MTKQISITFVQFYLVFGLDNATPSTPMPAVDPATCETCEEVRKEMNECKELFQAKLRDAEKKHRKEVQKLQHAFTKEKARMLTHTAYLEKKIETYKQKANEETERCKRLLFENNTESCQELAKRPRTSIVAEAFGSMIGEHAQMNSQKIKGHRLIWNILFLYSESQPKADNGSITTNLNDSGLLNKIVII